MISKQLFFVSIELGKDKGSGNVRSVLFYASSYSIPAEKYTVGFI